MNYPVGDFLIRIKNCALARKGEFEVMSTKLIREVAKVLKKEGFLQEISENKDKLVVRLAYRKKEPVILDIKLVSKPGLRVYHSLKELEKKRKPSVYVLSTPKGIMTDREAIKKKVGGEVIAEIF